MAIKLNIGVPSQKKTKQVELTDEQSKALFDKKLGDTFKGEVVDMPGFEFEITGGSDNAGFPMRRDVNATGRRKILTMRNVGNKDTTRGMRLRKTVAGKIVYNGTAQLNVKATKEGKNLFEEAASEEKSAE